MLPENKQIWDLLRVCDTQWRVGFGGAYGLDYAPIFFVAQSMGIITGLDFVRKIKSWEHEVLGLMAAKDKDNARCSEKEKEQCKIEFGEYLDWACKRCKEHKTRDRDAG